MTREAGTTTSIEEMYGEPEISDDELHARVDRSLGPRGPTMLYDTIGELGLSGRHRVLDVGCRDAAHACELVARFGCRVTAKLCPIVYVLRR